MIIAFILGTMVGAPIGFITAALCAAAKRAEGAEEAETHEQNLYRFPAGLADRLDRH